jgi:hypothetical protein
MALNTEEKRSNAATIFGSPQILLMFVLGLVTVFGGIYLALSTFPGLKNGIANPITGEIKAPTGDQNVGIDFSVLNNLPDDYGGGATTILEQQEPEVPEPLMDLTEPGDLGLIYPVTESVEADRPTMTWMLFTPGPYKVTVKDHTGQVSASAQNVRNPIWVVPMMLQRGEVYTWEVTAANGESQKAQFIVLTTEQAADWQTVRSQFSESHLALGLVAQQLGLLTIAEREYQELARRFPKAEAPARLLQNVLGLRE